MQHNQHSIAKSITLAQLEGDVHPLLHQLRQHEPVAWLSVLDAWLITRYDLAVEVMRDAKRYTVDHPGFSTGRVVGPSMLSLDGEAHLQHRTPFERPFRKRAVESRFKTPVNQRITELIDGFIDKGTAELRRDFAGPVAVYTMLVALGLELKLETAVLGWYDTIVDAVTRVTAGEPIPQSGKDAFQALSDALRPTLSQSPDNSLLAAAGSQSGQLTAKQIISNAAVLLFGGIETTEGMIANALYFLLREPVWLTAVQQNPSLIPAMLEETLRLEPAATVIDRYTTEAVQLNGVTIPKGDLVRVSLAAANRDPAIFTAPDTVNPHRDNLKTHVTFAQGPHVCLGIHLARLEAIAALTQLTQRLPNLTVTDHTAAQPKGLVFRKPEAVKVTF